MKRDKRRIIKQKKYSSAFQKQIVGEYESGQFSVGQLSRLYGMAPQSIYNWVYKYSTFNKKGYRIVEEKQSSSQKLKQLEGRIEELEAMLGRKQIKLEFLEKLIELASEELGMDLKKNYSNRPSSGSEDMQDK